MALSVVLITYNEEANLRRTLQRVVPLVSEGGEIIVVDNGSTDRTLDIAREFGARIYVEEWKGYAAQKNSAIAKATCEWVLSLDADEEVGAGARDAISRILGPDRDEYAGVNGVWIDRVNYFLGRPIRHGGFYEEKLRLFRKGKGGFKDVPVHEVVEVQGRTVRLSHHFHMLEPLYLLHYAYPALSGYIEHMNRYSSLGAEIAVSKGHRSFSVADIVVRPMLTFVQKYFLRLGFLDGREGLLLCLYHSMYVSWKYAKAWELARQRDPGPKTA